ncbi:hypothetical protein ACHAWF_011377 [Thalassiosira exigua]
MAPPPPPLASARKAASSKKSSATPRGGGGGGGNGGAPPAPAPPASSSAASSITGESILVSSDSLRCYSAVDLLPRRETFLKSDPSAGRPGFDPAANGGMWTVGVGGLICAEVERRKGGGRVHTAPFAVPWRACQILSLFRRAKANKLSTKKSGKKKKRRWGPLQAEVRWFCRASELDDRNKRREVEQAKREGKKDELKGELFETDVVEVVDVSRLLGRLRLTRGPGGEAADDDSTEHPVPTVIRRCCRYYLGKERDVFEPFDREWEDMLTRGLKCSEVLKSAGFRKAVHAHLNFALPASDGNDDEEEEERESVASLPPPAGKSRAKGSKSHVAYYSHIALPHRWSQFTRPDRFRSRGKRSSAPEWQLCVGDVVAVHCEGCTPAAGADAVEGREAWYPYRVPWSQGQVLAIHRTWEDGDESEGSAPSASLSCEMRWFPRVSEALAEARATDEAESQSKRALERLTHINRDEEGERTCEVILEGKQSIVVDCGSILGPIFVDGGPKSEAFPACEHLPSNRRTICASVHCDESGKPRARHATSCDLSDLVRRGFGASNAYRTKAARDAVLEASLRERAGRAERAAKARKERRRSRSGAGSYAGPEVPRPRRRGAPSGAPSGARDSPDSRSPDVARSDGAVPQREGKSLGAARGGGGDVVPSSEVVLREDDAVRWCASVGLVPRTERFTVDLASSPEPTSGGPSGGGIWTVRIGDLVCVEVEGAKRPSGRRAVACAPFDVAWRPCQVLSLFRRKSSTSDGWGALKVEVRRFYRLGDLDDRNQRRERAEAKRHKHRSGEEVFETGHVEAVDASLLLGKLALARGPDAEASASDVSAARAVVPTAAKWCRRYYLREERDAFEPFDREGMLARALDCSEMLRNKKLRKAVYARLDLALPASVGLDADDESSASLPAPVLKSRRKAEGTRVAYYPHCTLPHRWSQLTRRDLLCPLARRGSFPEWQLCVGDVVAVHCEGCTPATGADAIPGRDEWHPYSVPWSQGQVLAIYRSFDEDDAILEESDFPSSSLKLEIRWFPRVSEALLEARDKTKADKNKKALERLDQVAGDIERTSEVILEGQQLSKIDGGSVLGPVFVTDGSKSYESPASNFLSRNERTICDSVHCDKEGKPHPRHGVTSYDLSHIVDRGFDVSNEYPSQNAKKTVLKAVLQCRKERAERKRVEDSPAAIAGHPKNEPKDFDRSLDKKRQLFGDDLEDAGRKRARSCADIASVGKTLQDTVMLDPTGQIDSTQVHTKVSCSIDPFHVDVSARKSFYEEVDTVPDVDSYDNRFSAQGGTGPGKGQWRVKVGDMVTIRIEGGTSKDSGGVNFPFVVSWAPAEIVTIYKKHNSKESCAKLLRKLSRGGQEEEMSSQEYGTGEIMVEVRWFYRPHEIPGSGKKKPGPAADGELEEVFETDHVGAFHADCILSPVRLHDSNQSMNAPNTILGMPCIHYRCSRFWSIHRRSYMPTSSLSNRVSRGRMHSAHRAALTRLPNASSVANEAPPNQHRDKSWREAMQEAIQQLTLAEAAQDVQEKGMVLSCREKERDQIASFLRKAIRGSGSRGSEEEESMSLKSSMFIAGPPGTGKTASVRSVVSELQKEQHRGLLPEFNFIALNGMELRQPFDSYVKFWEALSGTRKEKLSPGDAVYKLEQYFCGDQVHHSEDSDSEEEPEINEERQEDDLIGQRPVTVLMLDELDYIVTKKETLIYNFFDWPLRATTARLVVIGISNTITLPEKLTTRVQSRIGTNRCYFRSYNVQDTITILKTRLGMLGDTPGRAVFEEDAIKASSFAARKTANLSGDMRKAFHMCRAAAEKVYHNVSEGPEGSWPVVKISDVQRSNKDTFTSMVLKAVSHSTNYEALLLIALGSLKRTRPDGLFTVKEILTKIESIANVSGEPRYMNARLSISDVLGMTRRLGAVSVRPVQG